MLIAFILHCANRNIKSENDEAVKAFYSIKDSILKDNGTVLGYDIQHIKGKKCRACGGSGQHVKYSWHPPYNAYDWDGCWNCNATGYFKMPLWICLHRIKYGRYVFHRPLKREEHIGNPFKKEVIGWEVTDQPIIEGYIEHEDHWFGGTAILILFMVYNRPLFIKLFRTEMYWKLIRCRNKIKNFFRARSPGIYHHKSNEFFETDDLPF